MTQHSRTRSIVTTQPAQRDSPSAWERPRDTVGQACCACSPGRHRRSCRAGSGAGGVNAVQGEAEPAAPFPYRSRDSGAFQHMTRSPHRPRDQERKELQPADNRPVTREASRRGASPGPAADATAGKQLPQADPGGDGAAVPLRPHGLRMGNSGHPRNSHPPREEADAEEGGGAGVSWPPPPLLGTSPGLGSSLPGTFAPQKPGCGAIPCTGGTCGWR